MKIDTQTVERGNGIGCNCGARYPGECGCSDVDWTDSEIYTLKGLIAEQKREIDRLRGGLEEIIFHSHNIAEKFNGVALPLESQLAQGVNNSLMREIAEQALKPTEE